MKILVTGAKGFIGKNLVLALKNQKFDVFEYDQSSTEEELNKYVKEAEFVIHLAGINRPLTNEEFYDGNANFTKKLVDLILKAHPIKKIPIIFSSSIQASLENDYGRSKKMAEDYLFASRLPVYIYRLANVFGKWCRPNYNSAAATFCYNVAHDLPIEVRDRNYVLHYNYIDDIVTEFIRILNLKFKIGKKIILSINPTYDCSLGRLADLLYYFKNTRKDNLTPYMGDEFQKKLYATYLSYLDPHDFAYDLNSREDNRGSFTEFLKTPTYGQVSVNVAHPGITKGNHYHHTKNEKFLTVSGETLIRFRKIGEKEVYEYRTSGKKLQVVDIPTGYAHSITNIGKTDSVTIMWANEVFDSENPDTFPEEV